MDEAMGVSVEYGGSNEDDDEEWKGSIIPYASPAHYLVGLSTDRNLGLQARGLPSLLCLGTSF
jgi:hypothetical protein